jgi:hypothetical protein
MRDLKRFIPKTTPSLAYRASLRVLGRPLCENCFEPGPHRDAAACRRALDHELGPRRRQKAKTT